MKEELQGKLVEILTSIQDATGKAADFAVAELPDIAQQYLIFGRTFETIVFVLITCMFGFLVWATIKVFKDIDEGISIVPGTLLVVIFIFWCHQIKDTVMVWVAPKVWLITELAKLIK